MIEKAHEKLEELAETVESEVFTDFQYEQIELYGNTINWLIDREIWDKLIMEVNYLDKFIQRALRKV